MRKLWLLCYIAFACASFAHAIQKENKVIVAGPFASVSHPIMHMIEQDVLQDMGKKIEFKLWKNPDELRALVLNGNVDFIAIPTNVAANLHNKGLDITMLNVSVWGILGMVSRDANLKTLQDFKGKEVVLPFREDMPDIIFKELAKKSGLNPKKDFDLKYVSSPIDAMQMLILRQADHVLLAEPAISIALRKTGSFPVKLIAPDLYRSVDLQKEWGRLFKSEAKIPQAGMAFLGDVNGNKALIQRFMQEYDKALNWYKNNPKKASKLVVETLPMLEEEGLADSIAHVNLQARSAFKSKEELEFFFDILMQSNAKLIGGKLPSDKFYYMQEW